MNFSADELLRYQRHLSLAGFGPDAQSKVRASSVLVIGAGGLSSPALLYLAAVGVGRIVVLDPDVVDVSNLQRQILYTTADAGRPKALAAAERLRALNPHVVIEPHLTRFARSNALAFVSDVDVVLDGSDNFATRYLVNDACVLAGRPFVYGAIQGFEGQASVFNHQGGPTYRCLFPAPPVPGAAPSCAEAGVLGMLPGLIGTVQATETIKLLTGLGEPLSGRLWLYDALAMTTRTLRLTATPHRSKITALPLDEDSSEACSASSPKKGLLPRASATDEISPPELRAALGLANEAEVPQLLDVRESWERDLGAINPSVHVPLGRIAEADLSALDPSRTVVVYCAGGVRSARALPLLRTRAPFVTLRSLQGGFKAWVG
ncbi:MAG: molybdopterin-synthase adenylyltransferase MoeB [Verrucomicrobia bacterium]|nr:MAG: molybdopterin-synthase adenylyltransferase MoeB [Verrucomicrobiota bacterium]